MKQQNETLYVLAMVVMLRGSHGDVKVPDWINRARLRTRRRYLQLEMKCLANESRAKSMGRLCNVVIGDSPSILTLN